MSRSHTENVFSHPDFTVGSGISPDQPHHAGHGLSPSVGTYTLPQRRYLILKTGQ